MPNFNSVLPSCYYRHSHHHPSLPNTMICSDFSKWWFISSPDSPPSWDPDTTTLSWMLNSFYNLPEQERPSECILSPGQLLYIPSGWLHATLNLGQTVFISAFV
eukprot:TRINITY_DN5451_c0_g1_i5.p1 TRINITY_DN5451_c0_g1~~TRINITY_DN5451_c0_g1_i5.p1  ORF type:complete len:104 (-),score=9.51 TRINITY_DN5451_c0_g1_i5:133-444(-)